MSLSCTKGEIKISLKHGKEKIRSYFEILQTHTRDRIVALAELPFMREEKHLFNTALAIYDLAVALNEIDKFNENFFELDFEDNIEIRGNMDRFPFEALKAVIKDANVDHVIFNMHTLNSEPELKVEHWTVNGKKLLHGTNATFDFEEA